MQGDSVVGDKGDKGIMGEKVFADKYAQMQYVYCTFIDYSLLLLSLNQ